MFLKHFTLQVLTLLPVKNIHEAKSFEPSVETLYYMKSCVSAQPHAPALYVSKGSPVDVRVYRRLSESERRPSYLRRKRRSSSKPSRLILCADRRMPSAVKVHTLLTGCLYPYLPSNLLPLNRFSRWIVIPRGSNMISKFFGNKYSFSLPALRTLSKS